MLTTAPHKFALRPFEVEDAAAIAEYGVFAPSDPLSLEAMAETGVTGLKRLDDGWRVIGAAGVAPVWENRGLVWAMLAPQHPTDMIFSYRTLKAGLFRTRLRRIEAHVDCNFNPGIRLALKLGFECEGVMRAFFPGGGDAFLFARINGNLS